MNEHDRSQHDFDPKPDTYILEIGPGRSPSLGFFSRFPGAQVIFVSLKKDPRFPDDAVHGAQYVEQDIMKYVHGDPTIPTGGFDHVVACNVISGAQERLIHIPDFIRGIGGIVKRGGTMILEETLEKRSFREPQLLRQILESQGFDVFITTERGYYLQPRFWHANSFHIEATKK